MIDLSSVLKLIEDEILPLTNDLDGLEETDLGGKEKDEVRSMKAQVSRDLLLLAARLDLASSLVMSGYWNYKGEHLNMTVEL